MVGGLRQPNSTHVAPRNAASPPQARAPFEPNRWQHQPLPCCGDETAQGKVQGQARSSLLPTAAPFYPRLSVLQNYDDRGDLYAAHPDSMKTVTVADYYFDVALMDQVKFSRPHIDVMVGGAHPCSALVDSGASITVLQYDFFLTIPEMQRCGEAIMIRNIHEDAFPTHGLFRTTISTPYDTSGSGLHNARIEVHVAPRLITKLILGCDFLYKYAAHTQFHKSGSYKVLFNQPSLPEVTTGRSMFANSATVDGQLVQVAAATPLDAPGGVTPRMSAVQEKDPALDTFLLYPKSDTELLYGDTRKITAIIGTPANMHLSPGATVLVTGAAAPNPGVLTEGIMSVKANNTVDMLITNTASHNMVLKANRPIQGAVAELLNKDNADYFEVSVDDLQTMSLTYPAVAAAEEVSPDNDLSKQAKSIMDSQLQSAKSDAHQLQLMKSAYQAAVCSLRESGRPAPGTRTPPSAPPSTEKRQAIVDQFNREGIDPQVRQQYLDLLFRHHDILSQSKWDLGEATQFEHVIDRKTNDVIYVKQFPIPSRDEPLLEELATTLTQSKVLIPMYSPHNSPIFYVRKKDASPRFVQDLRSVNTASFDDKYSIRDCRASIQAVGRDANKRIFSSLDFSGAFWQLPLAEESRQLCAFTLPFMTTQYAWGRTPQGLKGASASFSKLIHLVFGKLSKDLITYVDDLLASTTTHTQMLELLERIFNECRYTGMKINLRKSFLGQTEISWLGHNLSHQGITCEYAKADAVLNLKPPDTIKQLQSHLGLFQYFAHLIDRYALIAAPLNYLTSNKSNWRETKRSGPMPENAMKAWLQLRHIITQRPTVAWARTDMPYIMFCDASVGKPNNNPPIKGGISAILCQSVNNITKPIAYFSRQMRDSETKYCAFSAEQLAITAACTHFYPLLKGNRTTIFTDHRPLQDAALRQKDKNTLSNLAQKMLESDLDIRHIQGTSNPSDPMSRCALADIKNNLVGTTAQIAAVIDDKHTTFTLDQWRQAQIDDAVTNALREYCVNRTIPRNQTAKKIVEVWGQNLALDPSNLVLYYLGTKGKREFPSKKIVVPKSMQTIILSTFHGSKLSGHFAAPILVQNILQQFWWSDLSITALDWVQSCPQCHQVRDRQAKKIRRPVRTWQGATHRNERVHCDLVGPLRNDASPNKWILTMTDAFTRWCLLVALPNKQATTVADAILTQWILRFGAFYQLVSDNGGEFANAVSDALFTQLQASHHKVYPLRPRANGMQEALHRSVGHYIRAFLTDNVYDSWEAYLPYLEHALNARVHTSTGVSPWLLVYNEHPIIPGLPTNSDPVYNPDQIVDKLRWLRYAKDMVHVNDTSARSAWNEYYNRKSKSADFKLDDEVLVHMPVPPSGENKKFYQAWTGPWCVVQKIDENHYEVAKRGKRRIRVHADRMKFFDPARHLQDKKLQLNHFPNKSDPMEGQDLLDNEDDLLDQTNTDPNDLHPDIVAAIEKMFIPDSFEYSRRLHPIPRNSFVY